jgi:hypothetical protein
VIKVKNYDDPVIRSDLNNPKHEPHFDVTFRLPEIQGAEHLRIRPDGTLLDSETCVGKTKLPWEAR